MQQLLYTMMPPPHCQCEKRTPMYRTIALALFAFHGFNIKSESQVLHSIDGLSSAYDTIASVVFLFIHGTNLHTGLWALFTIQSSQQIFHCVLWTDRKWSLLDAALKVYLAHNGADFSNGSDGFFPNGFYYFHFSKHRLYDSCSCGSPCRCFEYSMIFV